MLSFTGLLYFSFRQVIGNKSTPPVYQTSEVQAGTLVVSLSASGTVSSANTASVTTKATGVVSRVYVKNGDAVKRGAKIAEIELDETGQQTAAQASSSYQSAKNSLASAQAQYYSLQSTLFAANQKFINDAVARDLDSSDPTYIQQNADWLAAEAKFKDHEAVIAQARTSVNSAWLVYKLTSPIIYAPISGTISGISLQPGTVVSSDSQTKIASIITYAFPVITLNLTEIDAPKVKVGAKAIVRLDAYSDKTFVGTVLSIDRVGSISSGVTTYPAVISLDTSTPDIYPNMSASATIILDTATEVLIVPTTAVNVQDGQSSVRVMKNGSPEKVIVTTGLASDTQIEITSGLSVGDVIVTGTASTQISTQTSSPFSALGGRSFGGGGASVVRMAR